MKTTLTTALVAAMLFSGAPLLASAQTQSDPIQIDKAQIYQQYVSDDQQAYLPGFAAVAFTNNGNAAATDVEFALLSDGSVVDHYNDVGSYAPGVTIKNEFPDEDTIDPDQTIAVDKVTFADGSVWINPDMPPDAPPSPKIDETSY